MRFMNNSGVDLRIAIYAADGVLAPGSVFVDAPAGRKTDYTPPTGSCRIGILRTGFNEIRPDAEFFAGDDIDITASMAVTRYANGTLQHIPPVLWQLPGGIAERAQPEIFPDDRAGVVRPGRPELDRPQPPPPQRLPAGQIEQMQLPTLHGLVLDPEYEIGTGMHDITERALGLNLQGFGDDTQKTVDVELPLFARAFAIAHPGSGRRVLLVSADLWTCSMAIKHAVMVRLATRYGGLYSHDNTWIAGTHTHSGPGGFLYHYYYNYASGGFDPHCLETIVTGIVKAVEKAHLSLAPGRIYRGTGSVANCGFNRSMPAYDRNPQTERAFYGTATDTTMQLLKFTRASGAAELPLGVLCWYAVHPTNRGQQNRLISGDSKGFAANMFEQSMGTAPNEAGTFIAGFANAHCGDISGNRNASGRTYDGSAADIPDYVPLMLQHAQSQYSAARAIFDQPNLTEVRGPIDCRHKFVNMRQRAGMPGAVGLSMFAGSTEDGSPGSGLREGIRNTDGDAGSVVQPFIKAVFKSKAAAYGQFVPALEDMAEQDRIAHYPKPVVFALGDATPVPMIPNIIPFQLIRIGDFAITGVPAELTTMAGRRLRDTILAPLVPLGVQQVALGTYANDYCGYVTTLEEYQAQHYEGASNLFGSGTLAIYQAEYAQLALAMVSGQLVSSASRTDFRSQAAHSGRVTIRNQSGVPWNLRFVNEHDWFGVALPDGVRTLPAFADLAFFIPPDVGRVKILINNTNPVIAGRDDMVVVSAQGRGSIVPYTPLNA